MLGLSAPIALAAVLLHSACSSEARPPAPMGAGSNARVGDAAGGSTSDDEQGGNAGAAGAAGAAGDGSGGSGMGGAGMGGAPPLRDDCTPSEACQAYCAALGPDPSCGVGTAAQCACLCEDRFHEPCPTELAAVLACVSSESASGDCRVGGRVIPGCEAESIGLELCDLGGLEQLCGSSTPVCDPYCRATTLSFCGKASESVGQCLCGCEKNIAGRCEVELQAFMSCAGDDPAFSCTAGGDLVPPSCPGEWQTFQTCLLGLAPDAGP
jgi:hypothetical protein